MTPRYSARCALQAVGTFSTPECIGHGSIHDLSVPGCRLDTIAHLRAGQTMKLEIVFTPAHARLRYSLSRRPVGRTALGRAGIYRHVPGRPSPLAPPRGRSRVAASQVVPGRVDKVSPEGN